MEQANMMPNGLPGQGAGGGNPMASMQRPQVGNQLQQIHASIMERLRQRMPSLQSTWQATFDIRERAGKIMQLYVVSRSTNRVPLFVPFANITTVSPLSAKFTPT